MMTLKRDDASSRVKRLSLLINQHLYIYTGAKSTFTREQKIDYYIMLRCRRHEKTFVIFLTLMNSRHSRNISNLSCFPLFIYAFRTIDRTNIYIYNYSTLYKTQENYVNRLAFDHDRLEMKNVCMPNARQASTCTFFF